MTLQPQNVQSLLQSVWQLLLKSPLDDGDGAVVTAADDPDLLRFMARINGEWNGRVILICGRSHARTLLANALRLAEDAVESEMVEDLVAELLNIVTGNLKGAMPGDTIQSTPQLISSEEAEPKASEKCVLELECQSGDHPVWLSVMETHRAVQ
jgi:CheY-specific phosphatase CheX